MTNRMDSRLFFFFLSQGFIRWLIRNIHRNYKNAQADSVMYAFEPKMYWLHSGTEIVKLIPGGHWSELC